MGRPHTAASRTTILATMDTHSSQPATVRGTALQDFKASGTGMLSLVMMSAAMVFTVLPLATASATFPDLKAS